KESPYSDNKCLITQRVVDSSKADFTCTLALSQYFPVLLHVFHNSYRISLLDEVSRKRRVK
ncbi:hypothetical protein ACFLWD_03105, partial [Chloroflexota bacterium]